MIVLGVYPDLPNEDYHGGPGVSSTVLKKMKRSPAHCRAYLSSRTHKTTKALLLGQAVHEAVLEPDLFKQHYYTPPDIADYPWALVTLEDYKRTAKALGLKSTGKKEDLKAAIKETASEALFWDDINTPDPDRELLTPADWKICTGIHDALSNRPRAQAALSGGVAETSLFWHDPDTDELCKARFDYYREDIGFIFDLKTCEDASYWEAARSIKKYQYHVSAAMYLEAARHNNLPANGFAWLFAEKHPPHEIGLYVASEAMLEEGFRLYRQYLETYSECCKSGSWPGYTGTFSEIDLP